ncbi:major facilitator superfamily MFS-1 [Babesia ovata]|uniref:Major facilitator superfamily MFS-1 n=1 Tax=Babesia ovata TaxID=189622 RepID=A0A2H6KHJ1_9APIC|nr:major facilitator superfamily MFS-1 [Babesia ovata]GBE62454.1 major facilitator superfamily MFS-1 [Babesia ovata]
MATLSDSEVERVKKCRFEIVDPAVMPAPHINPFLRLAIYIYYILSSGCIYWGWNGVQEILYKAGAFEEYCKDGAEITHKIFYGASYIDCPDREGGINNLYTLAYSTHFICSFFSGWLLDRFGPRVCFMTGHFIAGSAWLLIFCFPTKGLLLQVAFVLVGLACEACYIPMLSVSKYFPTASSTVIAVMGACRSLSFFVPTLLALIYHKSGVVREMLFAIGIGYLLVANVLCFVTGFFILPKEAPVAPSEKDAQIGTESTPACEVMADSAALESTGQKNWAIVNSIKNGLKSPFLLEFLILALSVSLFMPSIEFVNKSQRNLLVASSEGGDATGVFKYINVATFAPGPFLGAVMDRVGPALVMNLLHNCAVLYYACAAFDIYAMKIAACCCYLIAGSLCISTVYCYVNTRFPTQYFGTLVTVIFGFAGLSSLLNIPIYNWGLTLKAEIPQQSFRPLAFLFMVGHVIYIFKNSQGYMGLAAILSSILIYISVIRPKRMAALSMAAEST